MKNQLKKALLERDFDEEIIKDYFDEVDSFGENNYFEVEDLQFYIEDFEIYENFQFEEFK